MVSPPRPLPPSATDPLTGRPYEYRILGPSAYELCAEFERNTEEDNPRPADFWSHGPGRQCFQLEAKKPKR